jgi:hypothetical protein
MLTSYFHRTSEAYTFYCNEVFCLSFLHKSVWRQGRISIAWNSQESCPRLALQGRYGVRNRSHWKLYDIQFCDCIIYRNTFLNCCLCLNGAPCKTVWGASYGSSACASVLSVKLMEQDPSSAGDGPSAGQAISSFYGTCHDNVEFVPHTESYFLFCFIISTWVS